MLKQLLRQAPLQRVPAAGLTILCLAISGVSVYLFAAHMWQGAITADWPWLWRTGQWIIHHGLPARDLYAWTMPHHPWLLYQWLFEVCAAVLYDVLGATGSVAVLCVAAVALYVLIPAWFNARRGAPLHLGLALACLTLIPVSINFGLRPMLASSLALLLQFLIVERLRRGRLGLRPALLALALIYALWANMHLGLTLGLLSLLLFAAGDVADRLRGAPHTLSLARYSLLLAGSALASLANPYGWHIYSYIVDLSLKSQMNAHIHELMPPDPGNPYVMVGIALLAVFLVQWWRQPRRLGLGEALHVLAFALATACSLRFIVWAGLYYALVAPALWHRRDSCQAAAMPGHVRRQAPLLTCFCLIALIALALPLRHGPVRLADCQPLKDGIQYLDQHYPAGTHWFSSETIGSCTRLYAPNRKVFIDTRFDMYPEPFVMAWYRAYQHRIAWRALFERWHIQVILLADGAPLLPTLVHDPAYRQLWHDQHSHLFERRRAAVDSGAREHQNKAAHTRPAHEADS